MADIFNILPEELVIRSALGGAFVSIYFRWLLIAVIVITLSVQLLSGYAPQSIHSLVLTSVYIFLNISSLWIAVKKKYNPSYLGYLSAIADIGIITLNLYFSSIQYDKIVVTAAASMFMYPILFVLYTFRLDRKLLIFMVLVSVLLFNINYYYLYSQHPETYAAYFLQNHSHILSRVFICFLSAFCVFIFNIR